jgi:hypothetical protein
VWSRDGVSALSPGVYGTEVLGVACWPVIWVGEEPAGGMVGGFELTVSSLRVPKIARQGCQ